MKSRRATFKFVVKCEKEESTCKILVKHRRKHGGSLKSGLFCLVKQLSDFRGTFLQVPVEKIFPTGTRRPDAVGSSVCGEEL